MQGLQYDERLKQLGLMRLERRRVRSGSIETFKITSGVYDNNLHLFFQLDEGGRRGHDQKLLSKDSDLILENMLLVTKLLMTGTRYLQNVFIVKPLILLRSISRLHWNRELYSLEVSRYDSR